MAMGNAASVLVATAFLAASGDTFQLDGFTPANCNACKVARCRVQSRCALPFDEAPRRPVRATGKRRRGPHPRAGIARCAQSHPWGAADVEDSSHEEHWQRRGLGSPSVLSAMGTHVVRRTRKVQAKDAAEEQTGTSTLANGDPEALTGATAANGDAPAEAERRAARLSDPEAAYSRQVSLDVSLDRPVLPPPVSPVLLVASFVVCALAAVAVLARVPLFVRAAGSLLGAPLRAVASAGRALRLPALSGGLRLRIRLWLGSLQAWLDNVSAAWERAFGPEEAVLPADDWSVCTLQERVKEGPAYIRYRFRFPQPNSVLPLGLAQEVTLCGLDPGDRVVAASFCPITPRTKMGYLEILAKKEPGVNSAEQQLVRLLDSLAIGDELAVRPGRVGLSYRGPYSPITDMVMVASGQGIVPMLQLVQELLPSRESSVSSAAVVWLNERADDFVLYPELEKSFYKYHRKLDVSCIIERDLFGHQLASNPKVREAIPEFKIGTLAVVSGPDYFVRKVSEYLSRQGYPEEVIIPL